MDDFRESLRYDTNKTEKREITGRRTTRTSQRYKARKVARQRIMALILAGALTVGVGITHKRVSDAKEERYVSNMEEIQKYNINAQDLQLSAETYEYFLEFNAEIKELDENKFKGVSNSELAGYFSKMDKLYLQLMKEKVSSVIGLSTDEFTLVAPSAHGTEYCGACIKDSNMLYGIGINLKSKDIDDYMNDVLDLRDYVDQILNSDVDRDKLEATLVKYNEKLEEVATFNVLRETKGNDRTVLSTYRMETKDLQPSAEYEQESEIEK